jgi:hypothetical protein
MRLTPAERRRSQRIHVQIPMFVRGVDAGGIEFLDLTKTLDISSTGASTFEPDDSGAAVAIFNASIRDSADPGASSPPQNGGRYTFVRRGVC